MNTIQDTNTVANFTQTKPAKVAVPITIGDFRGAFKCQMEFAYTDLKAVGLDHKLCHKIAQDFGSDSGRAQADAKIKAAIGKANADGASRFTYNGKSEYVQQSPAMTIVRTVRLIEGMKDEKVITTRFFPSRDILPKRVQEYLTESEVWVTEQSWE